MRRAPSDRPRKSTIALYLVLIAAFAVLLRCLHLFNADYHHILSPDSHFFHWQAARLLSDQYIPLIWHSGLTYPLACAAQFVSLVSGIQPADALALATKILPPMLAIVSVLIIFFGTLRIYGPPVALWAAFTWAIVTYTVFVQAAGYLDRDGLSLLLLMLGVFLFFFGSHWRVTLGGKDIGWAVGAIAVTLVAGLLYIEWLWLGPVLLFVVLGGFVAAEILIDLLIRMPQTSIPINKGGEPTTNFLKCCFAAIKRSSWRPLALALGTSLSAAVIYLTPTGLYRQFTAWLPSIFSGTTSIAELQPLTANHIFAFGFLLIPLAIGSYTAVTRHRRGDLLCLSWLASLSLLALFANRIFLYTTPAICILCGLGFTSLFSFQNVSRVTRYLFVASQTFPVPPLRPIKIFGAALLMILLILLSTYAAFTIGSHHMVAADTDWQSALAYLKKNSPADSVVMTWWDRGYWILDLADRRPVVDNGYYGFDEQRLTDIAGVYCTGDSSEAARLMEKYGADYLIFSQLDIRILPTISEYGLGERYGDGITVPAELRESLYYRTLYDQSQSEGRLIRVYPSNEIEFPEIVILALH